MEIKPGENNIQSDYPVSSLDPCGNYPTEAYHQVVYSCSMYPIEPYQQLFPFQGGGINSRFNPNRYYQIEIIEGTDYAYMEKTAYQDSSGEYHPREYLGQYLTGVKGDELSGTGQYVIYGFLSSGTYVRENGTNYFIHFDNYNQTEVNVTVKITDLDSNITTYWYTTVVNPQLEIVDQQLDTLKHYYSTDVSLRLDNTKYPCNHPGYGGCPPDDVTFKIEITEGEQYGSIKNSETGEISTTFTGLSWDETRSTIFTYYANGVQPDSTDWVTVRHSSSDAEMQAREIRFLVKRNSIPPPSEGGSIYFQMDKHYAMPSDTINIHLLWINEVNDTIEFLPMQHFRVEIAEGLDYGRLVDLESGMQGDELNDASSNLQLIIESEIPVDIAKIILVAQADVLRFNRAIRGMNEIQQEEAVEINKNNKKEPIIPEFIIVGEHIVGIAEVTIDKYPLVVEVIPEEISAGDTAQIIPKKKNADGSLSEFPADQQFEIGMLDGCMLGKLSNAGIDTNYFYGVTQPFYFIADSSADSGIVKLRLGIIENTTGNKSGRGRITTEEGEYCFLSAFQSEKYKDVEVVVGNKYEIEILEPITNDIEWITDEPKMPEVICKARLKNYDKGEVTFEWEYWVSYEINRVNWPNLDDVCTRTGKIKFKGTSTSFNSQITTWLVEFKRSSCEVAYLKARDYKTNQDCEKTIYQWNEGEDVFIGGNVYIQVIAKNPSGRILGLKTLDNLKILGTNPDDITV